MKTKKRFKSISMLNNILALVNLTNIGPKLKIKYDVFPNNTLGFNIMEIFGDTTNNYGLGIRHSFEMYIKNDQLYTYEGDTYYIEVDENDSSFFNCHELGVRFIKSEDTYYYQKNNSTYYFDKEGSTNKYVFNRVINDESGLYITKENNQTVIRKGAADANVLDEQIIINTSAQDYILMEYRKNNLLIYQVRLTKNTDGYLTNIACFKDENSNSSVYDLSINRDNATNKLMICDNKTKLQDIIKFNSLSGYVDYIDDSYGQRIEFNREVDHVEIIDFLGNSEKYYLSNNNEIIRVENDEYLTIFTYDDKNDYSTGIINQEKESVNGKEIHCDSRGFEEDFDYVIENRQDMFNQSKEFIGIGTTENELNYYETYSQNLEKQELHSFLVVFSSLIQNEYVPKVEVSIEYLTDGEFVLEETPKVVVNPQKGLSYCLFDSYSNFVCKKQKLKLKFTDGVQSAFYLSVYHFDQANSITKRYNKYGILTEVISKDGICKYCYDKNNNIVSTNNTLMYKNSEDYIVTVDELGHCLETRKENGKYNLTRKKYYDKFLSEDNYYYYDNTDMISQITKSNEYYLFSYNGNKISQVEGTINNESFKINNEYFTANDINPGSLKKTTKSIGETTIEVIDCDYSKNESNNGISSKISHNNSPYTFLVDDLQLIKSVKLNDYEIDNYEYSGIIKNIVSKHNNKLYNYNQNWTLSYVSVNSRNIEDAIVKYSYDDKKRIVNIEDVENNQNIQFVYHDDYGYLKEMSIGDFVLKPIMDRYNDAKGVESSFGDTKDYVEYSNHSCERLKIYEVFANLSSNEKEFYSSFFFSTLPNNSLYCLYNQEASSDSFSINGIDEISILNQEEGFGVIDLYNNDFIAYDFTKNFYSFGMFFKFNGQITSLHELVRVDYVSVNLDNFNRVRVRYYTSPTTINSALNVNDIQLIEDQWYLLFVEQHEDKYVVYIDKQVFCEISKDLVGTSNLEGNIHNIDFANKNSTIYTNHIYITGISIGKGFLSSEEKAKLYDGFISAVESSKESTVDYNNLQTSAFYDANVFIEEDVGNVYSTLQNDTRLNDGNYALTELPFDKLERNKNFKYDFDKKQYVYSRDLLEYEIENEDSGTIFIDMKIPSSFSLDKELISLIDDNGNHIGFLANNLQTKLNINSIIRSSDTKLSSGWQKLALSWNRILQSGSMDIYNYVIKIYFNNTLLFNINSLDFDFVLSDVLKVRFNGCVSNYKFFNSALSEEKVFSIINKNRFNVRETYNTAPAILNKVAYKNSEAIITQNYSYDGKNNINSETLIYGNENKENSYSLVNNRLMSKSILSKTYEYVYDVFGRLIQETENGTVVTSYQYDTNGNVYKVTSPSNTKTFTYDSYRRIRGTGNKTFSYPTTLEDEHFLYPSKVTYGLVNENFTWNDRKLCRFKKVNNNIEEVDVVFTYDYEGRRIKKEVVGNYVINYYYNLQGLLIAETREYANSIKEKLKYYYNSNGQIQSFSYKDKMYFYLTDASGEIYGIINEDGVLEGVYRYNAFGEITSVTNSSGSSIIQTNPFRYKGYYYDVETQLFYCNSRYYSPELCRFISPDSIEYLEPSSINGLNLYCYCMNNPIMYADPSGHSAILFIVGLISSAVIGGLVSGGIAAGTAAISGGDIGAAFWGGFATGALSSLAVGVGMAIGGGVGLLVCGGIGFAAGFGGNILSQSISSYNSTGDITIKLGDAFFAGFTNSIVCMATMGSMNLWMSDSFSPALTGKTFGSRFVEYMSFDGANTVASTYFGIMYGLFDGAASLTKYLIEQEISKPTTASAFNY